MDLRDFTYRTLLEARADTAIATGTYDSFLLGAPEELARPTLDWLLWTMEQPWPELNGQRFPAEGSIGENWGTHHPEHNPGGLHKQPIKPFTAHWEAAA